MKTAEQQITDWIIECNFSSYTLQQRLEILNQFKSDAQKHGEHIGWKKGMSEAAEIVKHKSHPQLEAGYPVSLIIARENFVKFILTARDNKKEI